MLINAKRNAEIADAAKAAKAKANLTKYSTVADKAIPMVRERFEEEINERAEKGNRLYRCLLGISLGTSMCWGILADVLKELEPEFEKSIPFKSTWAEGVRHSFPESTVREYIWNRWDAMCMDLVDDLKANGYEIVVEPSNYSEELDERVGNKLEPTSEVLANHYIQVKW